MQAALISIAKWIATAVIIPMIQKWVASYLKTRERLKKLRKKKEVNQAKTEAYEKLPSDENFGDLP